MDQASRPLPPKSLQYFGRLNTLKLDSMCIIVSVVENIWTFWFVLEYFVLLDWNSLFWYGLAEM